MNYNYKIYNLRKDMINPKSYNTFVVEENTHTRKEWSLSRLQKSVETISKFDRASFIRTREWVLNNHPELLL
jgi:hypothetical protein